MKKLSSVFFLWFGFAFGVIAVLAMFLPLCDESGTVTNALPYFFDGISTIGSYKGAWPSFLGYMLTLGGTLLMGIIALSFVHPSAGTEKIVLISAGVMILAGTVLSSLILIFFKTLNPISILGVPHTGFYFNLFFGIFALGCDVKALSLDW